MGIKSPNGHRCYLSLACSIGSMSLALASLLQIPNTTDRISLQRGLFLISLGFIHFVLLTDFCNKYLLETLHGIRFCRKYSLMMSDVLEITNKVVSAIQAFFSFLVGFVVCKSTCSKSFVYASHFLMEAYGWFGTAYFMYDIWSMYKVHTQKIADKLKSVRMKSDNSKPVTWNQKRTSSSSSSSQHSQINGGGGLYDKPNAKNDNNVNGTFQKENGGGAFHSFHHDDGEINENDTGMQLCKESKWGFFKYIIDNPVMMIHHVFIGTFGLLVVTYIRGGGHCIYSFMFMMEFSTPFVSLRSILSTMSLKESRLYVVNGLLMLGTFFVCRVFMWPYVMWRYSEAINTSFWEALISLPIGCIVSIMILFLPQIYWFFLMVKGAIKVFFPSKSKKSQIKDQTKGKTNVNPTPGDLIVEYPKDLQSNGVQLTMKDNNFHKID